MTATISVPEEATACQAAVELCFHCSEPLAGSKITARINGRDEPVCCHGCRAVAELIADAGLGDYYRFRTAAAVRPDSSAIEEDAWAAYAQPEVAAQFTRHAGDLDLVTLEIDGLRCAACSWLIDHMLQSLEGVTESSTNASTGRAHVAWRRKDLTLADILRAVARLGYRPCPLSDLAASKSQRRERHDGLKRLAIAGFGMMQVMMFAVAEYSASLSGEVIEGTLSSFFRIVSLLVTTPVLFYAGAPILSGAWRNVRARTIGMDVPVSLALILAYAAGVWTTLSGSSGNVYFDSVTMFVFFLTLGRYVQMSVRHRTTEVTGALARQLPSYAHRVDGNAIEDVPVTALVPGNIVLIRPGETLPADGEIIEGDTSIDEAMLTGESAPVHRSVGQPVAAGTLNVGSPTYIRVTATASDTVISHIVGLLHRAQTQKPAVARRADRAASRFLRYVLIASALTAGAWWVIDPSRAFEATLAVLVVACPCAFAIATPAAISAAAAHLARIGILITRLDALEALTRIDRIVFDKTGTLTEGSIVVARCEPLAHVDANACCRIAAALELASEHPLARAFAPFGVDERAERVRTEPGAGVEGIVDGRRYRIGTSEFVAELHGGALNIEQAAPQGTVVVLGDERRTLARFELRDTPRPSAGSAIAALRAMNIEPQILSGDAEAPVAALAKHVGIDEHFARRSPQEKLAHVQQLQAAGHRIAVVGDGVNDGPVLASADVSIAMGSGTALAQASADMVLVSTKLDAIPRAVALARRTTRIARQNMIWAAVYNFGALPLAALGFVPPWLAALGMSLSSIAVVLNATRLLPARSKSRAVEPSR
jgi:Cu2+-exporting ATPase